MEGPSFGTDTAESVAFIWNRHHYGWNYLANEAGLSAEQDSASAQDFVFASPVLANRYLNHSGDESHDRLLNIDPELTGHGVSSSPSHSTESPSQSEGDHSASRVSETDTKSTIESISPDSIHAGFERAKFAHGFDGVSSSFSLKNNLIPEFPDVSQKSVNELFVDNTTTTFEFQPHYNQYYTEYRAQNVEKEYSNVDTVIALPSRKAKDFKKSTIPRFTPIPTLTTDPSQFERAKELGDFNDTIIQVEVSAALAAPTELKYDGTVPNMDFNITQVKPSLYYLVSTKFKQLPENYYTHRSEDQPLEGYSEMRGASDHSGARQLPRAKVLAKRGNTLQVHTQGYDDEIVGSFGFTNFRKPCAWKRMHVKEACAEGVANKKSSPPKKTAAPKKPTASGTKSAVSKKPAVPKTVAAPKKAAVLKKAVAPKSAVAPKKPVTRKKAYPLRKSSRINVVAPKEAFSNNLEMVLVAAGPRCENSRVNKRRA